jgi:transposase-like protein
MTVPPHRTGEPWTEVQKDACVAEYVANGAAAAVRMFGCSRQQVNRWARARGVPPAVAAAQRAKAAGEGLATKRARIREQLLEKVLDMLDRMDEEHIDFKGQKAQPVTYPKAPAAACQNYATCVAILIDKFRLEMGEPVPASRHIHTGDEGGPIRLETEDAEGVAERLTEKVAGALVIAQAHAITAEASGD